MLNHLKYLILAAFLSFGLSAQEILTPEDAVKTALEKNYEVLTSKNFKEIAAAQNNLGAAGMSPTLSINANATTARLNSHQVFNTGASQDISGARSSGITSSFNAEWTVFDGLRMFAIHKRLSMTEGLTELQLKQQMENTIYEVISAYYDVVRIRELIKASQQNLIFYEERRKIAELRLSIGSDSKVELLLSKSDENKARTTIIQLELQMLSAKSRLNTLMSRPVDQKFEVADTINVTYEPAYEDLKKSSSSSNSALLIARQNEQITGQTIREARSANLPFITVSGAYLLTKTQSQSGFLFSNRQDGPSFGITGRWTIFNGDRNSQLVKERKVQLLNQQLFTAQTQQNVDALVYLSYQSFLMNKQIVLMEMQNLNDSKEVQNISLERYRIGKASLLETIETQKNLEDAQARYINALYTIKIAETDLMRANGTLIK